MKRLLALLGALLLATACFDVEHSLALKESGAVDHTFKLGLLAAPLLNFGGDRGQEWVDTVNAAAPAEIAQARVEYDETRTWYVLEAHLPSVAAYGAYRAQFGEVLRERYREEVPWLLPPEIRRGLLSWTVAVDARKAGDGGLAKKGGGAWRLRVEGPGAPAAHDADRVDGGALIWERPIGDVVQGGVRTSARWRVPGAGWQLAGGLAVLAAVAGAGALAWRRFAPPERPAA